MSVESDIIPRDQAKSLEEYITSFLSTVPPGMVGALVTFTGIVREDVQENASGKEDKTASIVIECIEDSARKAVRKLARELSNRIGVEKLTIIHFTGNFTVNETMVHVIGCGAHRKAVFNVVAEAVDRYKREIPMWKKEILQSGASRWLHQ
ncbi:hypothetical protein GF325_04960 [Candidatus Bathyarchaeota archaeon]|nr:hypothetical protein [Candidatus Bathyarchaeota archaeon]